MSQRHLSGLFRALFMVLLSFWLSAKSLPAMDVLRLPWIFSDLPQLTADFNFSLPEKRNSTLPETRVELVLGGRFSQFGLPRGAARAPELIMRCEFVSPEALTSHVAEMHGKLNLNDVLAESGLKFERRHFSSSSRLVFKTEFAVNVPPGDYNVIVSVEDKELSIFSRRTLHVVVPNLNSSKPSLTDLKFCLAVGSELDKNGRSKRVLDPNPWRQVGGTSQWELIVAYNQVGLSLGKRLMRRVSIRKLRGGASEEPVWDEESAAPEKNERQVYLSMVKPKVIQALGRGIYVLKVELWSADRPTKILASSKTFEAL